MAENKEITSGRIGRECEVSTMVEVTWHGRGLVVEVLIGRISAHW